MDAITDPVLNGAMYQKTMPYGEVEEGTVLGTRRIPNGDGSFTIKGNLYTESFGAIQVTEGDSTFEGWELLWIPPYHGLEIVEEEVEEAPIRQKDVKTVRKAVPVEEEPKPKPAPRPTRGRRKK